MDAHGLVVLLGVRTERQGLMLELDGTPIATGSVAAQGSAAALTFTTFSGAAGWLTLDVAAVTSGGTRAADLEIVLWIARQ